MTHAALSFNPPRSERILHLLHLAMSSELRAEAFTPERRARARRADRIARAYREARRIEGQRAALVLHNPLTGPVAVRYVGGAL